MLYLLKRAGCEAVGAKTGAEGMQLAKDGKFDLITLDIDLAGYQRSGTLPPFETGPAFVPHPRSFLFPDVCASGTGQRCFELGAADYIVKPFDAFVFVSRIFFHLKTANDL